MQGDAELKMKMNTCTNRRLRQTGTHLPEKEKTAWSRRAVWGRQSGEEQRSQRYQNSIGLEQ